MNTKVGSFTTSQMAEYCGVDLKTVLQWKVKNLSRLSFPLGFGNRRLNLEEFIFLLKENREIEKSNPEIEDILIIDDDEEITNSLSKVLNTNGYKTNSAKNGFIAGLLLSKKIPKIITLDLQLPILNGFDVLKIIREMNLTQKVWIIVISSGEQSEIKKLLDVGADFYLNKPYKKNDLLKIIHKLKSA